MLIDAAGESARSSLIRQQVTDEINVNSRVEVRRKFHTEESFLEEYGCQMEFVGFKTNFMLERSADGGDGELVYIYIYIHICMHKPHVFEYVQSSSTGRTFRKDLIKIQLHDAQGAMALAWALASADDTYKVNSRKEAHHKTTQDVQNLVDARDAKIRKQKNKRAKMNQTQKIKKSQKKKGQKKHLSNWGWEASNRSVRVRGRATQRRKKGGAAVEAVVPKRDLHTRRRRRGSHWLEGLANTMLSSVRPDANANQISSKWFLACRSA